MSVVYDQVIHKFSLHFNFWNSYSAEQKLNKSEEKQ